MRMWMINPEALCDKHLMIEHFDLHSLSLVLREHMCLHELIALNAMEAHSIVSRHAEVASELHRRHMEHSTPLPELALEGLPPRILNYSIDVERSRYDLIVGCADCCFRYLELQ